MTSLVVGMGETGSVWCRILSKAGVDVAGVDINTAKNQGSISSAVDVLHICIPYTSQFCTFVKEHIAHWDPREVVIHSSVKPGTTAYLQQQFPCPIVYSPIRGVHSRMDKDLRRYTKYWACSKPVQLYPKQMRQCGIPEKGWGESTTSLELAKLLMDVTYYGWLIVFAQHVRVQADRYGVDEKQLWEFTDEIHKFLGNRPRMFSGEGIGGHCVLEDKDLLDDPFLDMVFSHDQTYKRRYKE